MCWNRSEKRAGRDRWLTVVGGPAWHGNGTVTILSAAFARVSAVTDLDRAILDFEAECTWWKYAGSKEAEIRERFDMSPVRYHQVLNALLDDPDAEAYDSLTVHRLQRVRARRRSWRCGWAV